MSTIALDLRFRNFQGETDFPLMVDIFNGCKEEDGFDWSESVEETAAMYKHMTNCDPAQDVIVAEVDGQAVGYGRCWWREQLDKTLIYSFFTLVLPAWRHQGIRRMMLRRFEARLHQIAADHQPQQAKYLQSWSSDMETHWTGLLESEGYDVVRFGLEMVRPDLENIPECPVPEGIEIRRGASAEWRQIWEAAREAFRDHWGASDWEEESIARWQEDPTFHPPLWRIAWDGDEIAGGVLNFINTNENEEYGRARGYTETIFVRRPWRGQGLAKALIARSFEALKDAGMTEAALGVDAENLSGALHLYRKMGFQEHKRFMTYRKPIIDLIVA